eukprot:2331872-Rhodomonas_salina.5
MGLPGLSPSDWRHCGTASAGLSMQDESETGEKGGKKPHRAFPTVIFSVSATTTGYSEPNRGRGQPRSENAGDAEADDEVQTREEGNELSVETDGTRCALLSASACAMRCWH